MCSTVRCNGEQWGNLSQLVHILQTVHLQPVPCSTGTATEHIPTRKAQLSSNSFEQEVMMPDEVCRRVDVYFMTEPNRSQSGGKWGFRIRTFFTPE